MEVCAASLCIEIHAAHFMNTIWHRNDFGRKLSERHQLFVEAANLASAIDEVDFQNPMPLAPIGVQGPHPPKVLGMDIQRDFVVRNLFVREHAEQMPGNRAAVLPT